MNTFETIDTMLMYMERYGGTFECKLAGLYRCADDFNRKKLLLTFNEIFSKYSTSPKRHAISN